MENKLVKAVLEQAEAVRPIYQEFLDTLSEQERRRFQASFHLRPTSGGCTIVSTLKKDPMRGRDVKPENLNTVLLQLKELLQESYEKGKLAGLGFHTRKKQSELEENAQAALVRQVVADGYGGFTFVEVR